MIGQLLRALFDRSGEEDPRFKAFVRGMVLGALVGAAIAGSRLWGRRVNRPHS